uniref:DnaJ homolog subfamily C member 1 n=1 Tax=Ciona savignyi TaxID=51511 RepID=H2YKK7_CIOSA
MLVLILLCLISVCNAQWGFSQDQTEIYDLVDEVKSNFYEFINVEQNAQSSEIRRAYRKLSLTMHPDKNKTEGAEENFRILVAIYEVLKNKEKREIYDDVLVNGLPAAYLYVPRQIRKMSLYEVSLIMSILATLGHFLFVWVAYLERKLNLQLPKLQKRSRKKKNDDVDDEIQKLRFRATIEVYCPKPSWADVLPILLARKFYSFVVWLPVFLRSQQEQRQLLAEANAALKLRSERRKSEESLFEESSTSIEEIDSMYEEPRKVCDVIMKVIVMAWWVCYIFMTSQRSKKGEWSEDDQSQLVKLMAKYPGGTEERWVKISKEIGRSVHDVTTRARISRNIGDFYDVRLPIMVTGPSKQSVVTSKQLTKTKLIIPNDDITTRSNGLIGETELHGSSYVGMQQVIGKESSGPQLRDSPEPEEEDTLSWSQPQQKLLEMSLTQFPKSSAERWDKIAKCVPGKSKQQCIARYRFLAEKISQKKKYKS